MVLIALELNPFRRSDQYGHDVIVPDYCRPCFAAMVLACFFAITLWIIVLKLFLDRRRDFRRYWILLTTLVPIVGPMAFLWFITSKRRDRRRGVG